MSQLKRGAILSYVNIALTNVIGLVLTPFIIRCLGTSEYGLYTLIGAFVGYISLMDFGLNNAIIRFVAKYKAKNDKQGEENFLASVMIIYAIIAAIVVLMGIGLYFNIDRIFGKSLTTSQLAEAKIMFLILIFNMAITLPGNSFSAICSGYEHFVFPRAVNVIRYLLRALLIFTLLLFGGRAITIVVIDTLMNLFVISVNAFYVFKKIRVSFKLHSFQLILIKEVMSYSLWIFIYSVVNQFQWQGGQIILGIKMNTTVVAIYGVGILLGSYYAMFSGVLSSLFVPQATKMTTLNASPEELTNKMIFVGRYCQFILFFILGAFILFGKQFIHLWVGDTYRQSWLIALIVMVGYTLPLIQIFGNSILEAKNKYAFKAWINLFLIMLGLGFGTFLTKFYGPAGMVFGICFCWVISQVLVNVYFALVIKLNIKRFFIESFKTSVLPYIAVFGASYFLNYIPISNWQGFLSRMFFYTVIFFVIIYKFAFNPVEKQTFLSVSPVKIVQKLKLSLYERYNKQGQK